MFDIEAELVSYFESKGLKAYEEIPPNRKREDEFIIVECVGGKSEPWVDNPMVAVQCWAPTKNLAKGLANEALSLLHSFIECVHVSKVIAGYPYNFPDLERKNPRYQITAEIITI